MNRRSRFVYWQKERLSTSNNSGCYHGSDETFLIILPSGSALLKLRAVMMLFTSLSILLATPGYWKSRFDCVWCLYKVAGLGHSSPPSLVSPESSWQPLCRLSASRDALDRWRPLQMASPQSTPAGLSSWGRGRCWWLSAERGGSRSCRWAGPTVACAVLSPYLPSSVWRAWSRHSVERAQRFWLAEGWWRRHLRGEMVNSESSGSAYPNLFFKFAWRYSVY